MIRLYDDPEKIAYELRVKCEEVGYEFLGYSDWSKSKSKVVLRCKTHDTVWSTTQAHYFFKHGTGCPDCRLNVISTFNRGSDEYMSTTFMRSGRFLEGTKFWRTCERNKSGSSRWQYTCPKCSHDKFVKAGLCSGVFPGSNFQCLQKGKLSCRCSHTYKYTKEQKELIVRDMLRDEDSKFVFVNLSDDTHSLTLHCPAHGDWTSLYRHFVCSGSRCPSCGKYGFSPAGIAYLYLIKAVGEKYSFTGYGITKNITSRLKTHGRQLGREGFKISGLEIFKSSGQIVLAVENKIKYNFDVTPQPVIGFKDEAAIEDDYPVIKDFISFYIEQDIDEGEKQMLSLLASAECSRNRILLNYTT